MWTAAACFRVRWRPRRIVDLMLQGYDVTNFEQMDEREVVQLFAQDVPETPEAIGIGSSRVLQFNRENTGVESFFNMGVTGADVRDNMTSYYKMVTYGKAPRVLLWSLDPWVFYGSEAAFDARADADLYNEFLTKVLNVPTDYEEPDKVELWKALADPAYFQGNVTTMSRTAVRPPSPMTRQHHRVQPRAGRPLRPAYHHQAVRRQRAVRYCFPQPDRGSDPHAGSRGLHELQQRTYGGL